MSSKSALNHARNDARAGKKPSTQAGEFVREEMHSLQQGSGNVRSRRQAIAIGLSEARRAGIKMDKPSKGTASEAARRKAAHDSAVGEGRARVSPTCSRGAQKAARTRARRYATA
jgi:hypothetical protein